jgi:hypothetical protein
VYKIPKEIKTNIRFYGWMYLIDVGTVVGAFVFASIFSDIVHKTMVIPFYITTSIATIYLIMPSIKNPKRRNYHTFWYTLLRDKETYHPIDRSVLDSVDKQEFEEREVHLRHAN